MDPGLRWVGEDERGYDVNVLGYERNRDGNGDDDAGLMEIVGITMPRWSAPTKPRIVAGTWNSNRWSRALRAEPD
jgi:hypothetical protein